MNLIPLPVAISGGGGWGPHRTDEKGANGWMSPAMPGRAGQKPSAPVLDAASPLSVTSSDSG